MTTNPDLLRDIVRQNRYINIDTWHDAKYRGEGVVVWNTEHRGTDHGDRVTQRILDAAPGCTVLRAGLTSNVGATSIVATVDWHGKQMPVEEFIKTEKVKIITRSVGGGSATDTIESAFWRDLKKRYKLIMFNSAGNDSSGGCSGSFPSDIAEYIAAGSLVKNQVRRAWYSSIGPEVDFITFCGWDDGTSFAAPYMAGIAAVLCSRFGNDMTAVESMLYRQHYSKDLEAVGFDYNTGWGIPILPMLDEKYITFTCGQLCFKLNGVQHEIDAPAENLGDTVFVPLRAVAEALGATFDPVTVNPDKTMHIVLRKDNTTITMDTGATFADKLVKRSDGNYNKKRLYMSHPCYVVPPGRVMVPIRFIAEALDCTVNWVQEAQKVLIFSK